RTGGHGCAFSWLAIARPTMVAIVVGHEAAAFPALRPPVPWHVLEARLVERHGTDGASGADVFAQLHLAAVQAVREIGGIDAVGLRLGHDAIARLLLFLDMMLDLVAEDGDLGLPIRISDVAVENLVDEELGTIVVDLGLIELLAALLILVRTRATRR